ncbi:hypothetical protein C6503_11240 [Candidatus Poribacteria bacterium]|nr:MAG: hypothetical protein C6503_11240 [Candidatus Poribacteria bacterium]
MLEPLNFDFGLISRTLLCYTFEGSHSEGKWSFSNFYEKENNLVFVKRVRVVLSLVLLFFYSAIVATAETVTYYPTDLGNIWVLETADGAERVTYTIEASEERIEDKEIALFKRTAETVGTDETTGEVYFVHFDDDGVKLHKIVAELGSIFGTATAILSPPVLFVPASLALGDTWEFTLETEVVLTGPVLVTYTYEVVAVEDVVAPAGTFENCLKVQLDTRTVTTSISRSTSYQWLAPNIGIVKVETSQEIVFNLISSNLVSDASTYDVTGDGVVNILDLVFVAARLGDAAKEADVNADGVVNILDVVLIAQNLSG